MSLLALVAREAQVRSPASAAEVPRSQRGLSTRPPAVAGSFYPAEAGDLARIVDGLLPAAIATPTKPALP